MNGKKVVGLMIIACLCIVLIAGCSNSNEESQDATKLSLGDLCIKLYEGVDVPNYEIVDLDASNFEYFAFIPYEKSLSAVAADAIVNIEAHSLVLIHTDQDNSELIANKILQKANPNKWLCVGAPKVNVAYSNHYIMLVMSSEEITDAISKNFELNMNRLYDGKTTILYADNDIREFE